MKTEQFGQTADGQKVTKYILSNKNSLKVSVIDLGATIVSIEVPGKDGRLRDVVLGYDDAADYLANDCYFGTIVGRNANRIAGGKVTLDGRTYQLEQNDNENNLHSGKNGFSSALWQLEEYDEHKIKLSYLSEDGVQDFPGNMKAYVTYTLTDQNELIIEYDAETDKTTVANFTNHSYFNLDGHDSGYVGKQELKIFTSLYTPVVDSKSIPTGSIASVSGTPLDFTKMKKIGKEIESDFDQIRFVNGYDHNYSLENDSRKLKQAARAKAAESGIGMDVYTDCPGIQLYTGNYISEHAGKNGATYGQRHGFCLETQYFPNSVNEENFLAPILKPEEKYHSQTRYCFYLN